MTIKYEERKYKVSLLDYLFIQWNKTLLFFKRQFRRLSILFCKQDILLYSVITLFWGLFGVGKYIVGQNFVATPDTPYTINHVLWELSEAWFSSVILSFVVGAYLRVGEYTRKIRNQHGVYVSAMEDFESIIERYIGDEKYNYFALYSRKCLNDTIAYIKKRAGTVHISFDDDMTLSIDIILERLKSLDELIKTDELIFCSTSLKLDETNAVRRMITEHVVKDTLSTEVIIQLLERFYWIVEKLRQPWRRDNQCKIEILKRLNEYTENGILDDFYYKMLLEGHQFPEEVRKTVDSEKLRLFMQRIREANQAKMKE